MSKRDLKPSGTQIFRPKGPCGHIKGALLQNIEKKGPAGILRELFYNILKKKAPAGIFSNDDFEIGKFYLDFTFLMSQK